MPKFRIREGFIVQVVNKVDLGDGQTENQVSTYYGKQVCDLSAEQADDHFHKLEPVDSKAEAYLESKVVPTPPAQALGLTPEALALVQAMALEIAKALVQAPAPAAQPAA